MTDTRTPESRISPESPIRQDHPGLADSYYLEGIKFFNEHGGGSIPVDAHADCPYPAQSSARVWWLRGFLYRQRLAELAQARAQIAAMFTDRDTKARNF